MSRAHATGLLLALLAVALAAGALEVEVRDEAGAALAEAVVIAKPVGGAPASTANTATIDQVNKRFVPHVAAIQVGTSVRFPNKDDIKHHVYSFSPPKVFQLKLYHGVTADRVVFDKPGLVVLGCNIHDGMIAYVYVVDAPVFSLTDSDGHAALPDLPPGDYELEAWHYRMASGAGKPSGIRISAGMSRISLTVQLAAADRLLPPLE